MTKQIIVGGVPIGGGAPIAIQSMTNTFTEDVIGTVAQINALQKAGCEIVRLAIPTMRAAEAIKEIKAEVDMPLVADIHFDYRLALKVIENGIDKVRLNPGNIGSADRVKTVIDALKDRRIPLRIGVNSGSVDKKLLQKYGGPTPEAMVESALEHVHIVEKAGYDQMAISIKSSSVVDTVKAYRLLSQKVDYPLHLGVTEVGTYDSAAVKSAMGIGSLLMDGIGDTLRVSVTGSPIQEIKLAKQILSAAEVRSFGINIVACPTCGRCNIDLERVVKQIEAEFGEETKHLKLAVMGCAVNGPGEAKEADLGIAGGVDSALIFKRGEVLKKVPYDQIYTTLKQMINTWES